MKNFIALAILALLALGPLVSRAGSGALEGTVRDAKTNQPVAGAQVQLKMPSAGKVTVTTDASGHFLFNTIPPGNGFTLKVSKSNYDEWTGPCPKINDGGRATKEITITRSGGGGGSSVTATAANGAVGGVVSSGGQPLAGVTVTIGAWSATTDANGAYSIRLPPGQWSVTAKQPGFKGYTGGVTVTSGANTGYDITMKKKK